MMVEAAVAHHTTTITIACEAFRLQDEQQQQAIAVLSMCEHFGVALTLDLLTLEALLMIHGLLSIMGHNWKGFQPGKSGNINRGREAALHQLVADYFSSNNSTFTDAQFCCHFWIALPLFCRLLMPFLKR